jgi:hypothetical protein
MAHLIMSIRGATGMNTRAKTPTIASILPGSGTHLGGTPVVITGNGFSPAASPSVLIDGVPCSAVVVVDSMTIHAVTGAHAAGGPFNVVVQNSTGGDGYGLSGTGVGLFTYT